MTRIASSVSTPSRAAPTEAPSGEPSASAISEYFRCAAADRRTFAWRLVLDTSPEFRTVPATLRDEVAANEGNDGDVSLVALSVGGQKLFALRGGDMNEIWYGVYDQQGRALGELIQFFEMTPDDNVTDRLVDAEWIPHRRVP